ncbi:hypothetical protein C8J57DRAFT_1559469 [Mycena rebaudengoi]|nr:hypothetical protein C8J57DRAFT_1559469 [Mycena rebaudengoi]
MTAHHYLARDHPAQINTVLPPTPPAATAAAQQRLLQPLSLTAPSSRHSADNSSVRPPSVHVISHHRTPASTSTHYSTVRSADRHYVLAFVPLHCPQRRTTPTIRSGGSIQRRASLLSTPRFTPAEGLVKPRGRPTTAYGQLDSSGAHAALIAAGSATTCSTLSKTPQDRRSRSVMSWGDPAGSPALRTTHARSR